MEYGPTGSFLVSPLARSVVALRLTDFRAAAQLLNTLLNTLVRNPIVGDEAPAHNLPAVAGNWYVDIAMFSCGEHRLIPAHLEQCGMCCNVVRCECDAAYL